MTEYTVEMSKEIKNRILVAVAAWAYEKYSDPIMDDAEFDKLAYSINLEQTTQRPDLDAWFKNNFDPCTGSWIWDHPELDKIDWLYTFRFHNRKNKFFCDKFKV